MKEPQNATLIVTSIASHLTRNRVILTFLQETVHLVKFHTVLSLCSPFSTINDRKYLHFNNLKNNLFTLVFFKLIKFYFHFLIFITTKKILSLF